MADREWTAKELSQRFGTRLFAQLQRDGKIAVRRYERRPDGSTIRWFSPADARLVENEALRSKAGMKKKLGQAFRGPWLKVKRTRTKTCSCGRVATRVLDKLAWCSKCYAAENRYQYRDL